MLEFVLPLQLRKNWLVSWKTRKVYERSDIRLITRCCEWHILQRHEKCQFDAFGDSSMGPNEPKYEMAPDATRKSFQIKPNLFLF